MREVEIAIKKVRMLSPQQARELLTWLSKQEAKGKRSAKSRHTPRQIAIITRKQKFKKWQDSIRGTTDWEIPRMPNDLVKPIDLSSMLR